MERGAAKERQHRRGKSPTVQGALKKSGGARHRTKENHVDQNQNSKKREEPKDDKEGGKRIEGKRNEIVGKRQIGRHRKGAAQDPFAGELARLKKKKSAQGARN